MDEEDEEMELPDAIILTNLPKIIFEDKDLKRELEELFKEIDPHATFLYFKVYFLCVAYKRMLMEGFMRIVVALPHA